MKKIIIPTNFTEESKNTIFYGLELAAEQNLSVEIIHVIDINIVAPEVGPMGGTMVNAAQINLGELEETARENFDKLSEEIKTHCQAESFQNFSIRVERGDPGEFIIALSKEQDTEAILLTGKTQNDNFLGFLGKRNNRIIEEAECPVWVIPGRVNFTAYRKVLYATDYKEKDIETIKKVMDLINKYLAQIILLHITEDAINMDAEVKEAGFEKIVKEKTGYNHIRMVTLSGKEIPETVNEFACKAGVDLIIMLKEDRSFFEKIFTSSETNQLIDMTDIPLLIYHESS